MLRIQTFDLHHCLQAPVLLALFPAWASVWMFTRQGAATYVTVPLRTAGLVKESLQHGPHALTSSIITDRSYRCQATKQLLTYLRLAIVGRVWLVRWCGWCFLFALVWLVRGFHLISV